MDRTGHGGRRPASNLLVMAMTSERSATAGAMRRAFLWLVGHTLNRVTTPMARAGRGPWSLVRHRGRRSGWSYETPVLLAEVPDGFVAELTYGPSVDWYRNIVAAGRCHVVHRGVDHAVVGIEACSTAAGLAAFRGPRAVVLRLLRRHEFRLLRTGAGPSP